MMRCGRRRWLGLGDGDGLSLVVFPVSGDWYAGVVAGRCEGWSWRGCVADGAEDCDDDVVVVARVGGA